MANDYLAMQTRIADEIEDDGLTSQIKLAILDAIKRHRGHAFWFNTVVGISFAVASTTEYLAPTLAVSNIAATEPINTITLLEIDDGAGANYRKVTMVDNAFINEAQTSSVTGRPRYAALVADSAGTRLRFYPIADQAYTAKLYGVIRFETPSADADTSPWFVDAEILIRQEAKSILAADVTKDQAEMQTAGAAAMRALSDLRKETIRRTPVQPLRTEVAAIQAAGRRRFNIYDGSYGA